MSLSKKLHKIRQKPDHIKERILIVCMAIGVSIVLTVWVSTFNPSGLKLQDTSNFIKSTKDYFTNSQGTVFDSKTSEQMFEQSNPMITATTTNVSTSTNTNIYIDTSTSTNSY